MVKKKEKKRHTVIKKEMNDRKPLQGLQTLKQY